MIEEIRKVVKIMKNQSMKVIMRRKRNVREKPSKKRVTKRRKSKKRTNIK